MPLSYNILYHKTNVNIMEQYFLPFFASYTSGILWHSSPIAASVAFFYKRYPLRNIPGVCSTGYPAPLVSHISAATPLAVSPLVALDCE